MKRYFILLPAVVLGLWLIVPTRDIVSPDWSVLVTDDSGQPIAGASVSVSEQQYTLESTDHEDDKVTGADGRVHFDGRRLWANGFRRVFGTVKNVLDTGVHASFGVHTHLHAWKAGYGDPSILEAFARNEREATAHGATTQISHIVLQKCPEHYGGFECDFPDDPSLPVLPLKTK